LQFLNFQAFVFVSTAYSNCPEKTIKECFYTAPANPEDIIQLFEQMPDFVEKSLDKIRADIIRPWPNAYAYSKALTENVVRDFGKLIPVAVVRPSIVVSTFSGKKKKASPESS
jgi:alcohol-forming fatty acyl-CoA reductase